MNDLATETPTELDAETIEYIQEQREWIIGLQRDLGSWAQVAKRTGIPQGTISTFAPGKYNGGPFANGNQKIADKVFAYRELLAAQAQIEVEAPKVPGYFATPTSERLMRVLTFGQSGEIVVAAMGPGTGKTETAKHFRECYPNHVFLATMAPSSAGMNTMQQAVLTALGERDPIGTPLKLSQRICDRVKDLGNPLLILDETQHLSVKALDEIRSWHDATGVGIAMLGNIGVKQRLEGGNRSSSFAQLFSRVGLWFTRPLPLEGDADALAAAWGVHGESEIAQIRRVSVLPGGLRGATKMLKLASMLATSQGKVLSTNHLQDAWAQLSSRAVAA